jgi:hypothetical protein
VFALRVRFRLLRLWPLAFKSWVDLLEVKLYMEGTRWSLCQICCCYFARLAMKNLRLDLFHSIETKACPGAMKKNLGSQHKIVHICYSPGGYQRLQTPGPLERREVRYGSGRDTLPQHSVDGPGIPEVVTTWACSTSSSLCLNRTPV